MPFALWACGPHAACHVCMTFFSCVTCFVQKEIHNDDAVQRYKCSHPQCGKQYTSMDVTELVSWGPASMAPGKGAAASKPAFSCSICGSEVAMVLDEGGKELGSMEDKKERRQVGKCEGLVLCRAVYARQGLMNVQNLVLRILLCPLASSCLTHGRYS